MMRGRDPSLSFSRNPRRHLLPPPSFSQIFVHCPFTHTFPFLFTNFLPSVFLSHLISSFCRVVFAIGPHMRMKRITSFIYGRNIAFDSQRLEARQNAVDSFLQILWCLQCQLEQWECCSFFMTAKVVGSFKQVLQHSPHNSIICALQQLH
jgi:hypothetical protein